MFECSKIYYYFTEYNLVSAIIRIRVALVFNRHESGKKLMPRYSDILTRGDEVGVFFFFFHQKPNRKRNENWVDMLSPRYPVDVIKVVISTRHSHKTESLENLNTLINVVNRLEGRFSFRSISQAKIYFTLEILKIWHR